jgi:hypothetical protein
VQIFFSAPSSQTFSFSANILLSSQFPNTLIQCKYSSQLPVPKHSHSVQIFSSAPSFQTLIHCKYSPQHPAPTHSFSAPPLQRETKFEDRIK